MTTGEPSSGRRGRDPVTDRGQVARAERLVPEPARDDRVGVVGVRGPGDDPRIAVGRDDAGRTEPGRVVREEGGRPAGIPAELGEAGRGRVDGVARHHPTRLSLPVRFAYRSARPKAQMPAGMRTMPITMSGTTSCISAETGTPSSSPARTPSRT